MSVPFIFIATGFHGLHVIIGRPTLCGHRGRLQLDGSTSSRNSQADPEQGRSIAIRKDLGPEQQGTEANGKASQEYTGAGQQVSGMKEYKVPQAVFSLVSAFSQENKTYKIGPGVCVCVKFIFSPFN